MLDKQSAKLEDTISKEKNVNIQKKEKKTEITTRGGETRHEVWEHIFSNDCTLKTKKVVE